MSNVNLLKEKCSADNFEKLSVLENEKLMEFIGRYVALCNPDSVFVRTDSKEDSEYIRAKSKELGEEIALSVEGHTIHFDGIKDQGRDKANTKFLVTKEFPLGKNINATDRESGLAEIEGLIKDSMVGRQMLVLFMGLGPVDSEFSIYAVQLTDSCYVGHSEDILYRGAYEVFKKKKGNIDFFQYVHSAGELENNVSKNVDKRRVYIDFIKNTVFSVNTQYAGNTVGLKKLALRLAIRKADQEGWLAEHMFLMGVKGPSGRKTYFSGAFPSFCGKTSTCMVQGESIIGDDIAYLRKRNGTVYGANVERGIFGIIKGVNKEDDPFIWDVITNKGEVIFSNVLNENGSPRWQSDQRPDPTSGVNFSGEWKKDSDVPVSHANARYTIRLDALKNYDPALEDPDGVPVKGIIYGGRDSDTLPPVYQSFDWTHGVVTIASSLESETTAATLGKQGVRTFNVMANLDFLSMPIGKYIQNHLDFVNNVKDLPIIFGVNYFLKGKDGEFLTGMQYKRVWLKWMELRIHGDVDAISTPIGMIPKYSDLKDLFKQVLNHDYSQAEYDEQFTIRVTENLSKIERIKKIYKETVTDAPAIFDEILSKQKERLEALKSEHGEYVIPTGLASK